MDFGVVEVSVIVIVSLTCAAVAVGITIKVLRRRSEERKKRLWKPRNSLQQYPSFVANRITGMITIVPHGNYVVKDELVVCPQFLIALAPPLDNVYDPLGPDPKTPTKPMWFIGNDNLEIDRNNNNEMARTNLDYIGSTELKNDINNNPSGS